DDGIRAFHVTGVQTCALPISSGAAPALSVRLRERLEEEIGPEYETLLTILAELRNPMANRYPDFQERRAQWYRIIDSDVLDVVRSEERRVGKSVDHGVASVVE